MKEKPIIALPKGRLYPNIQDKFRKFGYAIPSKDDRTYYHPDVLDDATLFLAKPKAIPQMLHCGFVKYGITGFDIMQNSEYRDEFVMLSDFGFNKVRMCLCSRHSMEELMSMKRPIIVATEFVALAERYLSERQRTFYILNTFGSTEGYVDLCADCIIDVVETGDTVRANGMQILDVLFETTTRLFTTKEHADEPLPKCLHDIVNPKHVYVEGNDGTGKTYLISRIENEFEDFMFHDRCVVSEMTLSEKWENGREGELVSDYADRLDREGMYFILDDTTENCRARIAERGDSLDEEFHTVEDLDKFRHRYMVLAGMMKDAGYKVFFINKNSFPNDTYIDFVRFLIS